MKAWILTVALTPMLSWGNANEAMDLYLNQDYQRAFTLFEKTAELGDGRSQFNLAVQYLRGQGVKADPVKAYAYFSVAMANDFKMAQQARKSVIKRLSSDELQRAQRLAQQLIAEIGRQGSATVRYELSRALTYNPAPSKRINPPTEYPSGLKSDGVPGVASYIFDIDSQGIPRDYILLHSYPAPEFAQSIAEKLDETRFSYSGEVFHNAVIRGVFSGSPDSEVMQQLRTKQQHLLQQARRGDVDAQAELAELLRVLDYQPELWPVDSDVQVVAKQAPMVRFNSITQPDFTPTKTVDPSYYNFNYLVNVDNQGRVQEVSAFEHIDIPSQLDEHAREVMSQWSLGAEQGLLGDSNWYLARFFYNNQEQQASYENHSVVAYADVKPLVNKEKEQQWRYWQLKAAAAGHSDMLYQLGINCNQRLLLEAAERQHSRAQLQLGRCLLTQASGQREQLELARYWLNEAAKQGELIAMRELAGWYVRYSDNGAQLKNAIALAEQVSDETDHPLAYAYLAAAHAKLGNFDEAIDYQEQALSEAEDQSYAQQPFEQTLAAYQKGQLIF
ncbi:hypothetical protein MHM89_07155 [Pseudoalteromonas sp. CNC9-20]|uniref:tetratricopeptide repeat protein n=1 Tax=Pseudoalteromonas sp. CNC9-20 TaxID=2917750 RepID=UPI001EF4E55E|nr:hypothetical protein [Pseudoalteromonas sp. CNC9-20]MCG7569703.1 hypothetical protein [Pseudoalteromonas sp. CNC9-20]